MKENEVVRIKDGVCVKAEVVNFSTDVKGTASPITPSNCFIHQELGKGIVVHCDKILQKLIAEGADVDIEVGDFNYNNIDIGVWYSTGTGNSTEFAIIMPERNSDTNYAACVIGFGGYSNSVAITETQQVRFTVRQMLEALGTVKFYSDAECYALPILIYNYQSTGCFAVTMPLTLDEYLEMVEFNVEITE